MPVVSHFMYGSLTPLPAERLSYSSETFNNPHTHAKSYHQARITPTVNPATRPAPNQYLCVRVGVCVCMGMFVCVYKWLLISLSHSIIAGW